MEQWVIYARPTDHPEHFVVRRWRVGANRIEALPQFWLGPDIEAARQVVLANYPDAYRLDRSPDDDPCIAEVWI